MSNFSFSGHETFPCRHFWPKKGYDFLATNHRFADADAIVELGVGKNMVTSIRFWLRALQLLDTKDAQQRIAQYLLDDKSGRDPYLERAGTLWLLHYLLVTGGRASIYSLLFNEVRKERIEFSKQQVVKFVERKCRELDYNFNENTVAQDVNVLLRTYIRPVRKTHRVEDDFSSLLIDLQLIQDVVKTDSSTDSAYKIESIERLEIPHEIILFAILTHTKYGNSISFRELLVGHNSVGSVFALNADGLLRHIQRIVAQYSKIVYTDDAGIRELQFKERPDKWQVLDSYYDR